MALGRKIGLDPSDIVLDGDPAPLPKRQQSPPIFGPCLLCRNGWMDQDATWYGGGLDPSDIVLDGDPVPPPKMGQSHSIFGPCLLCPNGWIDQDTTWYGVLSGIVLDLSLIHI